MVMKGKFLLKDYNEGDSEKAGGVKSDGGDVIARKSTKQTGTA